MRVLAAFVLLLIGCGDSASDNHDLTVTSPPVVDLNDFYRGGVVLPAQNLCAAPKLKLNAVPLSTTGTSRDGGLVLPTDAAWEVLNEVLQDLHPLCDGDRILKLDVDCSGQEPFTSTPNAKNVTSVDVTFRKTVVGEAFATPGVTDVSPLSFPTLYFESVGVEEDTVTNSVVVSGVAGHLDVLDDEERTEIVFVPNEPFQPGQSYSARLNLGIAGLRTAAGGCILPDGRDNISWTFNTRDASTPPFQATVTPSGPGVRLRWDALGASKYSVYAVPSSDATTGGTLVSTTRDASLYLERSAGSCFRIDAEPHGRAAVSSNVACVQ